ncbi:hypothetical protein HOP50_06g41940 [Chloropicon primus]|uniref:Uncharacterized protein n=1 Tax=Chloropicon primus TaxID=1764295 RepID=A0A5B8MMA2_9CHLO|nr:hypothetical protein A3770_06p41840 [Chloropicon primus]UPR00877.1 hypothetical protein HOP50_06g41940 [Chloropicon primus]|eukprot:QDZ21666.1 hypothetical protein A3770_06p41840 [Chloropicon primus]
MNCGLGDGVTFSSSAAKDDGEGGAGGETVSTDKFQDWWCFDLSFGRKKEAYEDCRLSDEVKDEMYIRHKDEGWTVERLAGYYRIRQQRVMGILALRELRAEDESNGVELDYAFETYANKETDTSKRRGSGEAHVKAMPSQPRYVLLSEDEENDYVDIETRLLQDSANEEAKLVKEFKERLDYNMWKKGKNLERMVSRHKTAAKRPEEGWTFVVRSLDANGPPAYAVEPDGKKRELTEDEQVFFDRATGTRPRPRVPKL